MTKMLVRRKKQMTNVDIDNQSSYHKIVWESVVYEKVTGICAIPAKNPSEEM